MRRSPPWLVGLCYIPFGFYTGFVSTALPLLLTARGVTLDRVAQIVFVAMLPSFSSWVFTPLVDCGLHRKTWALLLAAVTAACQAADVFLLDKSHQVTLMVLLVMGQLAAQLYGSALGGMTPSMVDEQHQGSVSGWLNVANLGGAALGGMIGIFAVQRWTLGAAAALLAAMILIPAIVLQFLAGEDREPRRPGEMFGGLLKDIWTISKTKQALLGFMIFVVPAAAFAAQNLFSGLGRDFGSGDTQVAWITGAGVAIACTLGSLVGGWMCDRMDRRMLFVGTGVVSAAATLGMAFGPRVGWVFATGVLAYNVLAGVNYAAASAVAFEIMGLNNPLAATQYAMLMASCNVAIEFAVWADGRGYHRWGATGMLCTDAALGLGCGTLMMTVLAWNARREKMRRVEVAA
jgi:MFS family permease